MKPRFLFALALAASPASGAGNVMFYQKARPKTARKADPQVDAAWKKAFALMSAEKFAECEKAFAALAESKDHESAAAAQFNRGGCALEQSKAAEAEAAFREARRLDPSLAPMVALKLGELGARPAVRLIEEGKTEEGRKALEALVAKEPANAVAWSELAFVHAQAKRWGDCVSAADRALKLHERYPEALTSRGGCYFSQEKTADAIRDFSAALAAQPDFPGALVGRAHAYGALGKCTEALRDARKAIQLDSSFKGAFPSLEKRCHAKF